MLSHLYIENYALIEKLEINFSGGFSAITGETGAGKSIIIGALSLLLGQRADSTVLFNKNKKCIIEGCFKISDLDLDIFFIDNELDNEESCLIRREIATNGKSRAFINDTPVNLGLLKELSEQLVDIHSQNTTLSLFNSDFQMSVTDNIAGNQDLLKKYQSENKQLNHLKNILSDLKIKEKEAKVQSDYLQFVFDELENSNLQANEEEVITNELEIQNNAEEIKNSLLSAISSISLSELNVLSLLNEVTSHLNRVKEVHPQIKEINERILACIIELKDIVSESETIEEKINFDSEKINYLTSRLDLIFRLEKKHNVSSVIDLIEIKDKISDELLIISNYEEKIVKLESELKEKIEIVSGLATDLRKRRLSVIPNIEKSCIEILANLGMKDAQLNIHLVNSQNYGNTGADTISFLFNANKGGDMKEIAKVISGGELSRLMLAIKSIVNKQNLLPTVIFDEIDNGVSGDIAAKVGNILKKMSLNRQLIAITHLPQIASKANEHFYVTKNTEKEITHSIIKKLNAEERVEEIAKMLSNEIVTASALETARELMNL